MDIPPHEDLLSTLSENITFLVQRYFSFFLCNKKIRARICNLSLVILTAVQITQMSSEKRGPILNDTSFTSSVMLILLAGNLYWPHDKCIMQEVWKDVLNSRTGSANRCGYTDKANILVIQERENYRDDCSSIINLAVLDYVSSTFEPIHV